LFVSLFALWAELPAIKDTVTYMHTSTFRPIIEFTMARDEIWFETVP